MTMDPILFNCRQRSSLSFNLIGDVFDAQTIDLIKNRRLFKTKELMTPFLGRCFTICHLLKTTLVEGIALRLSSKWNYKLFIHLPSEEFWLGGNGYFPTDITFLILGIGISFKTFKRIHYKLPGLAL